MPINVSIKDNQVKDLIEFLSQKHKEIKARVFELDREAKDTMAMITQLKQAIKKPGSEYTSDKIEEDELYSAIWSWVKRIAFAIRGLGKPSTANEIAEYLKSFDPDNVKISSISATLSQKSGEYEDRLDFIRSKNSEGELVFDIWKEKTELSNAEMFNEIMYGSSVKNDGLPF